MITIIVAYDDKYGIGKDGGLPWHLPEDMQHFQDTTIGHWVVMGRRTWESIPKRFRPLMGRFNVVVSRNPDFKVNAPVLKAGNVETALRLCRGEVFLIGGGQVYQEALAKDLVDRIIASEVKGDYDADVFFPTKWPGEWEGKLVKEYDRFIVREYLRIGFCGGRECRE